MRRIIGLLLIIGVFAACDEWPTEPTITTADVELFNETVVLKDAGASLEWSGNIFNHSRFVTEVAVKLEMINPDSVVFFTTSEHIISVDPASQVSFKVIEAATQVPTPVFTSISGWNMVHRLVSWKVKTATI